MVNLVGDEGLSAERGVIYLRGGDFLIFGNDGYSKEDGRAKREVESLREQLAGQAEELGFANTEDGYTWGMLVRFLKGCETSEGQAFCRKMLTLALWEVWGGASKHPGEVTSAGTLGKEAEETIDRLRPKILQMLTPA
jgi:hypothetical protein